MSKDLNPWNSLKIIKEKAKNNTRIPAITSGILVSQQIRKVIKIISVILIQIT